MIPSEVCNRFPTGRKRFACNLAAGTFSGEIYQEKWGGQSPSSNLHLRQDQKGEQSVPTVNGIREHRHIHLADLGDFNRDKTLSQENGEGWGGTIDCRKNVVCGW